MQSSSAEAPAREAVKRFTNKILFLSRLIKAQFRQAPGFGFTGLGVLCLRYHPSGSHCLNRYVRKSTVAFSVASPYNRYDFGQTTDSCL